jgi:hypothetical protein
MFVKGVEQLPLACLLIHPAGLESRPFPLTLQNRNLILQLPNLFLQPLSLPRQPLNDF